uniref:Uncharacterized protein n=1 Tax=Arundo donax TaxID=35708 RepID=A0A0A8YAM6_ARUDO
MGQTLGHIGFCWARTCRPTYPTFFFFVFSGYSMDTYPVRIHIGYVSDTGYGTRLPHPCFRVDTFVIFCMKLGKSV